MNEEKRVVDLFSEGLIQKQAQKKEFEKGREAKGTEEEEKEAEAWLTVDQVEKVCTPCAKKMREGRITKIKF